MLFPTVTFAVFFTVVLTVAWALHGRPRVWKQWILAASWLFYAWWDWRFVALLAASILLNHLLAHRIEHGRQPPAQRRWLAAGVALNLAVLGFFKYYGFFVTSLLDALRPLGLTPRVGLLEVVLPVGISFFTFAAISYLIEVRRGDVPALQLLDAAVWLSFFPYLVSGPITRVSEFLPQLIRRRDPGAVDGQRAFLLITRGLFKKVVLSSFLAAAITEGVFTTPARYSAAEVLAGIYAYTAQIYTDFSGYTDIAIGVALLLGFRLPDNFNAPYLATSLQDFWNRWHMTLSRWFRDFVFTPLTVHGSRTRWAAYRNLLVVFALTGLWHGAAWTFVVWGGIHGAALALERAQRDLRRRRRLPKPADTPLRTLGRWALTFHVVAFAWVFFRADSLGAAAAVLARLVTGWGPAPAVTPLLVAVIAGVIAVQAFPHNALERAQALWTRLGAVPQVAALAVALLVIDVLGPEGVAPFIYFRF